MSDTRQTPVQRLFSGIAFAGLIGFISYIASAITGASLTLSYAICATIALVTGAYDHLKRTGY